MPPILQASTIEEIVRHLFSVFGDFINDRTRGLVQRAVEEEHQLGVSPTSRERVRSKVHRYFGEVLADYKEMKRKRTQLKKSEDFDPQLQVVQRKVKRFADQCEGLKMTLMGAMILIFANYPQCKLLLSDSAEKLLEQHVADEERMMKKKTSSGGVGGSGGQQEKKAVFTGIDRVEMENMLKWRNYVRIGMVLFNANRNQGVLFRIATRLEGVVTEYITGGGASAATLRRYAIYKRQEKIFGDRRPTWRGTFRKLQAIKYIENDALQFRQGGVGIAMLCSGAAFVESEIPSKVEKTGDGGSAGVDFDSWDAKEGEELEFDNLDEGELAYCKNPSLAFASND